MEATDTSISGIIVGTDVAGNFRIGEDFASGNRFDGIIDWMAVSNVARSSEVIEYRNLGIKEKFLDYGPDEVQEDSIPFSSFIPDLTVDKLVEKI